ncbi:hypothetical protein [Kitasatospora griseola]|uniref:hypothetical protein n=1 Tax=Kitasatospora griseola TaxID=2064 RepID=UPI0016707944|nr:hypothetical protein [Kitasatospora griseola]GGQ88464.1 hypothetical protein GCM10010195_50250 [Kitasatospora griseola]
MLGGPGLPFTAHIPTGLAAYALTVVPEPLRTTGPIDEITVPKPDPRATFPAALWAKARSTSAPDGL